MTDEKSKKVNKKVLLVIPVLLLLAISVVWVAKLAGQSSYKENKKGIQLAFDFTDDALDLGIGWGFVNFSTAWMSDEPSPYFVEYKGRTYYFNEAVIDAYDSMFEKLSEGDVKVVASFLNQRNDTYPYLRYPGVDDSVQSGYYAFYLDSEEARNCAEAYATFFVTRYGPEGTGTICGWLVGNEVNDNLQYHYMNPCDMQEYVSAYYDEFRLFYDVIKEHDPDAEVYIPLEHRWQTANTMTDYGGRWFLEYFHELELERGQMDWGVAWHPYPYPLGDPDTLDDGDYPTIDTDETPSYGGEVTLDYTTPIISMKNLDILTDYFKENLLKENGEVRSIILSEVGYTSYSVICGDNEAKQAANIAYAYYKAQANPYIQAIIIRAHRDEDEGSPYFQFGLRDDDADNTKKLSYDVYRTLGTAEGMKYDDMLLAVLGADKWEDIIEGYKKPGTGISRLFSSRSTLDSGRDISSCRIEVADSVGYTGLPVLSDITVYDGDKCLVETRDYDLSYTSNVIPGTAKVTVVGRGAYAGFKIVTFEIVGDYADILDPAWYFTNNPKARDACGGDYAKAEDYFLNTGLSQGDQGCKEFNVRYYLNNYPEVFEGFGTDYKRAAMYYISEGKAQGQVADHMLKMTEYHGYDYAYVYDPAFVAENYPDIYEKCGRDPYLLLEYFVTTGMDEGMRGAAWFDPAEYCKNNPDVSEHFGDDIRSVYMHFCENGYMEGRYAGGGTSDPSSNVFYGTDYSLVFDADFYMSKYEDVRTYVENRKTASGEPVSAEAAALEHFVLWGMKEGRIGSETFDPVMYKALYSDVREAYGDMYEMYYFHYMKNGSLEGRFTSVKALHQID